jgi:gliding motility-associated lipoprotein GldD
MSAFKPTLFTFFVRSFIRLLSRFCGWLPAVNLRARIFILQLSTVVLVFAAACNSPYIPKQAGYFKIPLPEKKYVTFNEPSYPYTFEYPAYANIVKDTTFFESTPENPYWINIDFPQFAGRIYMSYKGMGRHKLEQLVDDAYKMTNKHTIKASGIEDSLIRNNQVTGVFFKVEGDVATANQFFLTDSTRHFVRGALYFDATPNEDSLRPVNDFLVADMRHLINTFRWK